ARVVATAVVKRLRRKHTPVVRTLHNITPHRIRQSNSGERLRKALDDLTAAEVHLVPGDPHITQGAVHLIPHGSYREPYAGSSTDVPVSGRLLHFGRLEEYKGVPELLGAATSSKV